MAYTPVAAAIKGLRVLEAVNRLGPASLREITEATGLPKASTVRLLETLRHAGYVSVQTQARRYLVTARVLALSNNFHQDEAILSLAAPVLKALRERTGWPSDLAVYQHGRMVIADTDREPGAFSLNRSVGSRVPMTTTALGKAYLAFCDDGERRRIFEMLAASAEADEDRALTLGEFERAAEAIRERGYAVSDREQGKTIRALGVPVRREGRVLCAFNLIVPAQAMSAARLEAEYARPVLEAAGEIERLDHG